MNQIHDMDKIEDVHSKRHILIKLYKSMVKISRNQAMNADFAKLVNPTYENKS